MNGYGFGGSVWWVKQDFGDSNGFDNQMNFGGTNAATDLGEERHRSMSRASHLFRIEISHPPLIQTCCLLLDQSGPPAPGRPRWQQGGQAPKSQPQNQSQLLFNQDQTSFPNNG